MKTCLQEKYGLFINGQWQPASDGKTFKSYNPANGELLAECAQATDADLDLAVDSAWKAWDSWKQTTPAERAKILNRIADIIDENAEHLAMVETLDNGKPIRETMAIDIPYSAEHFRYFAGAVLAEEGTASMLDGNTMSLFSESRLVLLVRLYLGISHFLMGCMEDWHQFLQADAVPSLNLLAQHL